MEWDAVFLIGLCDGQFPHSKSANSDAEMEEERRLFYVAVTRAKKHLYMMHPCTRYDYQLGTVSAPRSRFLEELSGEDYEVWRASSQMLNPEFDSEREPIIEL
ncbi:MAG: 3'-5' exonuclease [Candidatus Omnitrophota bacterium]